MSGITPITSLFTSRFQMINNREGSDLEGQATGLLVLVEIGGVDGVERPDEAEDPQEDPPQQVVAQAQAEPGSLRGHPLVDQRQRGRRGRGHRARRGEQRRAGALDADRGRVLGVLGVAAHTLISLLALS
jgi:hypothetical protein